MPMPLPNPNITPVLHLSTKLHDSISHYTSNQGSARTRDYNIGRLSLRALESLLGYGKKS